MSTLFWKDRKRWLGLPISFTEYSFDDERLYVDKGFTTKAHEELYLFQVRDIRVTRTLLDRICFCGTITLISSDKSESELHLEHIRYPMRVKEMLTKMVAFERSRRK